ncbi:TonB-dependent receptor [Rhizosphaericola mali]|uniref:TonB-dependent receptor n=1 Tax=Rhizosphaericola mali TaxID=2545455 RepID=A0A5P2G706_9BACT|nr:TonB-dependent receptor [Rhizosphaericola mali]QES90488.1 TonB-dependent receptor [Rhizosphaericola mali]
MFKSVIKAFFLSSGILFSLSSKAQTQTYTGYVKDPSGAGIEGATIKTSSSKKGIITNAEGKFTITVPKGDKITVTAIGYVSASEVAGVDDLTFNLTALTSDLTPVSVGSRGAARSSIESPVPVDVVKLGNFAPTTARADLNSQLMLAVPSFNYNKNSGSDISDAVDFSTIRGMSTSHTLVLVNGKRRHLSSYISSTSGSSGVGVDISTIPQGAIDHVEVLRDGASAQYGSDAIAGVLNIVLKKNVNHFTMTSGWSGYYDHKYNTLNSDDPSKYYTGSKVDGNTFNSTMDWGFALGKKGGFVNIGGNVLAQGKTFRGNPDNNDLIQTRRAFGDGSVTSGGGMYNMELPLSATTKLYSFGGYNYKHSNVYAWTRKYSNPLRFPEASDGSPLFIPSIMKLANSSDGTSDTLDVNNLYYNPQEDVYMKDYSGALGLKGKMGTWDWSLSNNTGYSKVKIYGNKTFNASLPMPDQAYKNRFYDGGFNYLLNVSNLDFTNHFNNVFQGLTLSFGGEFRYENYEIVAGEPDSYRNGGATYDGPTIYNSDGSVAYANGAPKAAGSQGYPGYQPTDAVKSHRTNAAGYLDASFDLTKRWLLDIAARFENYSDFGFVNVYKAATRYKITDNFNIRGSFSTGFRAPSLQELNFSNTNTVISKGELVYQKIVPNYSDLARLAGIPKLKQETSTNYSLGFTWQASREFTATIDGYLIKMKNRIITTGAYDASTPALTDYMNANSLAQAIFFANAVNTTNKGIDVVLDYHHRWSDQHFNVLFTGNIQKVSIDKINVPTELGTSYLAAQQFFSTQAQYNLRASAPGQKFIFNPEYGVGKFSIGGRLTYWGKIEKTGYGYATVPGAAAGEAGGDGISNAGLGYDPYVELDNESGVVPEIFKYNGKFTTDLYMSFILSKSVNWVVGVDNIFNVHPDPAYTKGARANSWNDFPTGGYFDNVQMGFNGMRMWTKLVFNF